VAIPTSLPTRNSGIPARETLIRLPQSKVDAALRQERPVTVL